MQPMSKKAKAEAYDALKARSDLLERALEYRMREDKPDAVVTAKVADAHHVTLRLYHVMQAHAGIVLVWERIDGQVPVCDAITLGDLELRWRDPIKASICDPSGEWRRMVNTLVVARQSIFDPELQHVSGEA